METITDLVQKALEGIELLKHPGHPDQKVHGRRGGKMPTSNRGVKVQEGGSSNLDSSSVFSTGKVGNVFTFKSGYPDGPLKIQSLTPKRHFLIAQDSKHQSLSHSFENINGSASYRTSGSYEDLMGKLASYESANWG